MTRLRLVSFDVWNTLLSIKSFYRSVAAELAKITSENLADLERGLIEGYSEVKATRRIGGFKDSEIVQMALEAMAKFLNISREAIAEAVLNAIENSPPTQHVIEGAIETIRHIKEFGLKVIVIGNVVFWPGNYNRILLEKAGLSRFIDKQFYADELKVSKPKPGIFTEALSEFNVHSQEALHVGDSVFEDFAGAILSHMNAVLIDQNVDSIIKLSDWNAYIIPDIRLLEKIVKELACS